MSGNYRNIKIRVSSEEESVAIQKFLRRKGIDWHLGGIPSHESAPYLFVDSWGFLSYSTRESTFLESVNKEVSIIKEIVDLVPMKKKMTIPEIESALGFCIEIVG